MAGPTRSDNVGVLSWDGQNYSTNDYSSTSNQGFIPEIWSGKMVEKFYDATVFGTIANTDYEGEIKGQGDNVVIRTIPSITIFDYEIGQKLNYERPASDKVELPIDKAKGFAFQINNVEKVQMDINAMDAWSADASEQMKNAIDTDILAYVFTEADTANAGLTAGRISGNIDLGDATTPQSVTSSTIVSEIINHGLVLDEQNCPEEGRWIVLPAWAVARLKLSDLKDASITGDSMSPMRNGRVGMIDRFTVYMSNNLNVSSGKWDIVAGHKKGLTFASQMTDLEKIPNPYDFGQLIRGLNVYGRKVVDGTLITHGVWSAG